MSPRAALAISLALAIAACGEPDADTGAPADRHAELEHDDEPGELHVELPEAAREAAGIGLATAGPARLRALLPLHGRIVPNEDSLAHLTPRFPGVVREVRKRLGDSAAKQEVLAVVESNESLHPYEIRSPVSGTVIFKEVSAGEFVSAERVIYAVADLSTVWADLDVYPADFSRLRVGQRVTLSSGRGVADVESTLAYLSPIGSQSSQTLLARAVLPNPEGSWPPGLFVRGDVVVAEKEVAVAVRGEAIQRLGERDVVFVRAGSAFEARPVRLGLRDGPLVEIEAGLEPGDRYASANSFVLKSDALAAGASHDH
jgi:cobalt-zinc-cadmium efflux system membrane fusion protein